MIINVHVTPRASQNKIVQDGEIVRVYTTAVPDDGNANTAVIKMLAKHYNVPKTSIRIVRGHTSRDKILEF